MSYKECGRRNSGSDDKEMCKQAAIYPVMTRTCSDNTYHRFLFGCDCVGFE